MATPNEDLQHIRNLMERSATFVSLSGLSGVGAGTCALIGCALTFYRLDSFGIDYFDGKPNYYSYSLLYQLAIIALITFVCAFGIAAFFTIRKSKNLGVPLWSSTTKHLAEAMLIPLVAGGVMSIILTSNNLFYLVAPCMLIFYGLALVSASKYTHRELFWLGIFDLVLGLVSAWFVGYGLLFWGIGFGILHIIYGVLMYLKYH